MFNPKTTFPIKTLWNKLGTFYSRMTPEGKKVVEKYWDALFRGMEGLYYDLYQVNLSSYLETSPGYIEHAYIDHSVVFEGVAKNTELLPQISGNYYYQLPEEGIYLSIPTLSGKNTGQILHEGVDYEIHNFNKIKFLKNLHVSSRGTDTNRINVASRVPFSTSPDSIKTNTNNLPHSITEDYLAQTAITLVPSLTNFIIPAFGREEPQILLESGYYEPYTSGWRSGTLSYLENRKQWSTHLTKWAQGMIACFSKPPTLKNLEQSYGLVRGFPFANRQGVVEKIEKGVGVDNAYDYVTIKVDERTNAYIALGASWDTKIITRISGNFIRVYSKGSPPPLTINSPAADASIDQDHDFWFHLKPREAPNNSELQEGKIGVHINGVPFYGIPNETGLLTQSLEDGWIKDHMYGYLPTALGIDNYNGRLDGDTQAYSYVGLPVGTYTEDPTKHSPLIGYALDGFPIYGEYGYVNNDGSGGVKKMEPSYKLSLETRPITIGGGQPDGKYRNDYVFESELGDLDECNGRFGVTPEYPKGIYHYHFTQTFPYTLNSFKGTPSFNTSALPTMGIDTISTIVRDTYEIPTGGAYNFGPGDPINKFDILLSGIQFIDYLTDPDTIDSIVTASGSLQKFDVTVAEDFEFNKGFVIDGLTDYVVYTGSFLQDADVNFVDIFGPDNSWDRDIHEADRIQSGMNIDGTANTLYSTTPGTYDPHLPTQDSVYQSFAGISSISPSVEGTYDGTDMVSGIYTQPNSVATPTRIDQNTDDDDDNSGGNITY